jgi:predicted RNA-binding Zn-ribbon protein involved in translation (DUF1610 family)
MSLHLFATPVQCTQCGTTVKDSSVQRCPNCGARLKERRAPRRLAGVEQRYGSLRVLLGIMRFLGVIVFAIGALVFFSGLGSRATASQSGILFMGAVLVAVVFLAAAGLFELLIDVEENTRSSFKLQQMILEELAEGRAAPDVAAPAAAPAPVAAAAPAAPAVADAPLAPAAA